jgi:hypothetical protein
MVLCVVGPAKAMPITGEFNVVFTQVTPAPDTWEGMFTADTGIVTSFMANIGDCQLSQLCLYDTVQPAALIFDGTHLFGVVGSTSSSFTAMRFLASTLEWDTFNVGDSTLLRVGTHMTSPKAVSVPEPSGLILMLVGLGALAAFSFRSRARQA